MKVARTILEQIGGNKFIAMTGAKNFVGSKNSVSFRIGRNAHQITHVKIELTPMDLYNMTFYRCRKANIKVVGEISGIYCDQLQPIFAGQTGLDTHL